MTRTLTILLVGAALLAVPLAGCGSDDDATPSSPPKAAASTPTATATEEPAPAEAPAGGVVKADIKGFAFAPKDLTVKVGQEIAWTNQDSAPHTVTAQSGAKFDSGTMQQGATYKWKATKAGSVEYLCAIHPSMVGTITVE